MTFGGQLDASEAPPLEADRISDSRTGPPLRPNNRNPGRSPRSNLSSTVAGESPSSTPSSRAVSNLSVTPSSPVYARDSRRRSAPHSAMKGAHHARDVSAGLPIPGPDVLELARLVDDQALAERLETAYGNGARILALEIQERESILRALENGHPQPRSPSSAGHSSPNTSAGSATGWCRPAKPVNIVWGLRDRRYKFSVRRDLQRGKSRMGRDV